MHFGDTSICVKSGTFFCHRVIHFLLLYSSMPSFRMLSNTFIINCQVTFIRKTCPCHKYPLKPHFYIVKLGYAGVYLFSLFLLQNIDCGYSLEPPRIYVLSKNKKIYPNVSAENFQILKLKKSLFIALASIRNVVI